MNGSGTLEKDETRKKIDKRREATEASRYPREVEGKFSLSERRKENVLHTMCDVICDMQKSCKDQVRKRIVIGTPVLC